MSRSPQFTATSTKQRAKIPTGRLVDHAPQTRALAGRLARVRSTCVGCQDCRGLCRELVDLLTLPDVVLKPAKPS